MSDAFFSALAERFRGLEQPLNALDAATGDGDHGAAMRRGLEAVAAAEPGTAAQAFRGAAGGASGTLFGALVGGLEAALAGEKDLSSALAHAAGQVAKLGMAKRGDKTMLDALVPAAEAARHRVPPFRMREKVCLVQSTIGRRLPPKGLRASRRRWRATRRR